MVKIPAEIERLYKLGFAIHWLRPKSKIPVDSGWTSGPRADLEQLKARFKPAYNFGVRLGAASKVAGAYLAVIDVDVKSDAPKHAKEAHAKLFEVFPQVKHGPHLLSGRGNGSAHFYVRVAEPLRGNEVKARSTDLVKVKMPSVAPSKREAEELTDAELADGIRLRPAWEISILCEGRQSALVGSIHPDTGKAYSWGKPVNGSGKDIPLLDGVNVVSMRPKSEGDRTAARGPERAPEFELGDIGDASTLPLTKPQLAALTEGEGVKDRSAKVYELCIVLTAAGIPDSTILSVFTDRRFYLGNCAFDHAKTGKRQLAARWVEKYCLRKAKARANETPFDIEEIPSDADLMAKRKRENDCRPKAAPKERVWPVGLKGDEPWCDQIEKKFQGNGRPALVKTTLANVLIILEKMGGEGFIRFNEFTLRVFWMADTPWGIKAGKERSSGFEDAVRIKIWFADNYKIEPPNSVIDEALMLIAFKNQFHPVKDYLESLEWDGVKRVDRAFRTYFGCQMADPYLRKITRKFFLACITRIYRPGTKFDGVITLEGEQGVGKSSFGQIIAGDDWFINGLPNLHDKDAALNLVGMWICELGELAAVNRSELALVKEFITRDRDNIRPPYGQRRQTFPRTIVFIGTTDKQEYLTDPEGNRRFWPVSVGDCDFDSLNWDRDQLWAEAKWIFDNAPEKLYLKRGGLADQQAKAYQESRRIEDAGDSIKFLLMKWDAVQTPKGGIVETSLTDLFKLTLTPAFIAKNQANTTAAGKVLRGLGYAKAHTKKGNVWRRKGGSP